MIIRRGVAGIRLWTVAVTSAALLTGSTLNVQAQRAGDRGANQPGATGNRGGGGGDRGANQPGAAGNTGAVGGSARQTRAAGDPGFNQAGAAGNGGGDRGVNQPGAAGNRRP